MPLPQKNFLSAAEKPGLWTLHFGVAEQWVFHTLTLLQRRVIHCVLSLLGSGWQRPEYSVFLRHSFLCYFRDNPMSCDSDVTIHAEDLISTILEHLDKKHCPNFFIKGHNVLQNCLIHPEIVDNLANVMRRKQELGIWGELVRPWNEMFVAHGSLDEFHDWLKEFAADARQHLIGCLLQEFDDVVHLLEMASYAYNVKTGVSDNLAWNAMRLDAFKKSEKRLNDAFHHVIGGEVYGIMEPMEGILKVRFC